jgi:hypothetical protein
VVSLDSETWDGSRAPTDTTIRQSSPYQQGLNGKLLTCPTSQAKKGECLSKVRVGHNSLTIWKLRWKCYAGCKQMHWFLIATGLVAIIGGVLGKEFTVADVISLAEFKPPKRSSTWSGRIVFIGVGAALILIGIVIALR